MRARLPTYLTNLVGAGEGESLGNLPYRGRNASKKKKRKDKERQVKQMLRDKSFSYDGARKLENKVECLYLRGHLTFN